MLFFIQLLIMVYLGGYILRLCLCICCVGIQNTDLEIINTKQDVKDFCNPFYGLEIIKTIKTKYNNLNDE